MVWDKLKETGGWCAQVYHADFLLLKSHLYFRTAATWQKYDPLLGKKRKCSPGSSGVNSGGGSSKPAKVARLPAVNNVHPKHAGPSPAAPGLTNSSLLHQVGQGLGPPWGGPWPLP